MQQADCLLVIANFSPARNCPPLQPACVSRPLLFLPSHNQHTHPHTNPHQQIELLLLIGAPRQAWERIASRWYNMVEWVEQNCLGWKLPREADTMPMYKQMALFYPEEHAYTFDAYRYVYEVVL